MDSTLYVRGLKPHYPPINEEFERLNIVHFLHNEKFDKVQMSAKFKNTFGLLGEANSLEGGIEYR
ncbi:8933_t:CDS:2 [Rhizophagus irregularis]|nr:8933_t:CDS:2 [Rhizophagus irregularis]